MQKKPAIHESQPGLVCRFGTDLKLTYANTSFLRFFAIAKNALAKTTFTAGFKPSDRSMIARRVNEISVDFPFFMLGTFISDPLEKSFYIEWEIQAILDESKRVRGFKATGRDLTAKSISILPLPT